MDPLLYAIIITALPAIELRGAIPAGMALGGDPMAVALVSTLANILIIFPIFFALDRLFGFFRQYAWIDRIVLGVRDKTEKYVEKYGAVGLMLFVAVPLPGSGAYSGCIAAKLFDVDRRHSYYSIAAGVTIAGTLVTLASLGVLSIFA